MLSEKAAFRRAGLDVRQLILDDVQGFPRTHGDRIDTSIKLQPDVQEVVQVASGTRQTPGTSSAKSTEASDTLPKPRKTSSQPHQPLEEGIATELNDLI